MKLSIRSYSGARDRRDEEERVDEVDAHPDRAADRLVVRDVLEQHDARLSEADVAAPVLLPAAAGEAATV